MYRFLDENNDKKLIREMKITCSPIVNEFKMAINNDGYFLVNITLVGSGKKNLITQDENHNIDLDYNLLIIDCKNNIDINDCKSIKTYFIEIINDILAKYDLRNCEDSTSAITSRKFKSKFKKGTLFSFDIGITVDNKNGTRFRLIHKKTGKIQNDSWVWEAMSKSKNIDKKAIFLRERQLWNEVRNAYLRKKNMYLSRRDKNHPSYVCYIEAVNEIYYKYTQQ